MNIRNVSRIALGMGIVVGAATPIACDEGTTSNGTSGTQASSSSSSGGEGGTNGTSSNGGGGGSTSSSSGTSGSGGAGGSSMGMEILHADFQKRTEGPYAESMVEGDFGHAPPWNDGLDEGRATIVDESGNRFLRVTYTANEYGPNGGVQFKVPFEQTFTELYLSYRVRFAAGYQFVKGGKIPGLVGGTAPTGCINDTTGFSARMMWRTGGEAVQYMYFPEKLNACGDDYAYDTGNGPIAFEPGKWHTVEHRIVMNTPGAYDGIIEAWFDGAPSLSEKAFLLRLAGATYGIDTLYFSTFFGGGDASWAPTAPQIADFDDFIVSTGPISH